MRPKATLLLFFLALPASGAEAPAEEPPAIHACTDADGNVVYQSDPCDETIPKPIVAPAPAKASARKAPASVPVAAPRWVEEEPSDKPVGRADPRLESPRQTWRTFLGALRSGDRALAVSCLSSSALAESGPTIEALPVAELRERADALPEIDIGGVAGPFRVATARGRSGRPRWIFFEKARNGDWKIAAM